ncbi:MAG: EscU/YscU/HrcU family type III secretion system export apparatus switch protein [Treponema sp.]|nr:EscU/YscU/HrcU family type III secretion system export apparatus switch protein [Treponema sp.]
MKKISKAVALKYPEGVEAPIIVAKGIGKSAEKIITEAKKNDILIKEDTVLVDMLGLQNVGDIVPEETWDILAELFAFIINNGDGEKS